LAIAFSDLMQCRSVFILYASIWSTHGLGEFTRAIGLEQDLSDRGYGIRSKRYVMLIDNGTVTEIHVEPPGE
jgi:peroxiredoxin